MKLPSVLSPDIAAAPTTATATPLSHEELVAAGRVLSDQPEGHVERLSINGKRVEGPMREAALAAYRASQSTDSPAGRALDHLAEQTAKAGALVDHAIEIVTRPLRSEPVQHAWSEAKAWAADHFSSADPSQPPGLVGRSVEWLEHQVARAKAPVVGDPERVGIGADAEVTLDDGTRLAYCPIGDDRAASADNQRLSILTEAALLSPLGLIAAVTIAPFAPTLGAILLAAPIVETTVAGAAAVYFEASGAAAARRGDARAAAARHAMAEKTSVLGLTNWLGFASLSVGDGLSALGLKKDTADLASLRAEADPADAPKH